MTQPRLRICLMGASYTTGNLGVSALAEGAIQGILSAAPEAEITIVSDSGRTASTVEIEREGKRVTVRVLPIRYGKTVWKLSHIGMLYWQALLLKLGIERVRRYFGGRNPLLRALDEADVVADLSGGDSFTDIYGTWRMFLQTLFKCLVIFMRKRQVLLPQTIGPFERRASRAAARFIMRRVSRVYTRDEEGMGEIRRIAGEDAAGRARLAPDVGFLVEPKEPADAETGRLVREKAKSSVLVGVNVSGLLMSGGYTRGNQFGLRANYRDAHVAMVKRLLGDGNVFVIFVPHVITQRGDVEDDASACEAVRAELSEEERARTYMLEGAAVQGVREVKWVIGQCAFFAGSRMHSCIAALSQGVPAVGVAYSRKFRGVFETMGVRDMVVDLRAQSEEEIVATVMGEFARRDERREGLIRAAAGPRAKAREMFVDVCGVTVR